MADFHTNGDDVSKKKFKKGKENIVKADVMLVKQNVMVPTILPAAEDTFSPRNYDPKEKYNLRRKISKTLKEPEICTLTNKLNRKMKSPSFEATVPKSKKMIEEKKSAPPGFPKYTCLDRFLSKSTENNSSSCEKISLSEYTYAQKSLPVKKKDLGLQVKVENSEHKLENEKSKCSESANDNVINIFSLSNCHRSNSGLLNCADDLIKKETCTSTFNQEKRFTFDNKGVNQKSSSINKKYTTTNIFKSKTSKLDCEIKYSWQDIENWIPPAQKEEIMKTEKRNLDCKISYSWQVIGISTQTSLELLQNVNKNNENKRYECKIKYSWQIVGKGTQVSLNDYENHLSLNGDYWEGSVLLPRENYDKWNKINSPIKSLNPGNKVIILYSEGTQTLADKRTQTELTDCRVKYSWENLIEQHLKPLESVKLDALGKISYDKYCVENLKTRLEPIKCSTKYSWQNLIRQRLK